MRARRLRRWALAWSTWTTSNRRRSFAQGCRPMSVFARLTTPGARRSRTCSPQARCWVAITTQGRADSASPSSPAGWPGGSPHASDAEPMRAEVEKIVGAAAVDERPVRDLWPAATMAERAGETPERVLVARPSGREQLAAILRWATANAVMVAPRGGASGVRGDRAPKRGELVLDMGGLDRILEIDEVNLTCRVESGVNGMTLEKTLNEKGLTLGHYPSSLPGTTIGGLVSTRSSGQESSRYGSIEDMVLSLAVVLPDGTFAAPRPGPRSAVGPALHELWLGAEGALGVVLGAVLRVHRLPASVIGRGYSFSRLADGLEAMRHVMQSGIRPLVMRLYDHEDSVFNRYEVSEGECVLVIATAGEEEVAQAEAKVVGRLTAGAKDLGEDPWSRWQEHRFGLSAEWLKGILEPPGARGQRPCGHHEHERDGRETVGDGGRTCSIHRQPCFRRGQDRARLEGDRVVAAVDRAQVRDRVYDTPDGGGRHREERSASVATGRRSRRRRRHAQ